MPWHRSFQSPRPPRLSDAPAHRQRHAAGVAGDVCGSDAPARGLARLGAGFCMPLTSRLKSHGPKLPLSGPNPASAAWPPRNPVMPLPRAVNGFGPPDAASAQASFTSASFHLIWPDCALAYFAQACRANAAPPRASGNILTSGSLLSLGTSANAGESELGKHCRASTGVS